MPTYRDVAAGIEWIAGPPPPAAEYLARAVPRPGQPVRAIILSAELVGVGVHYSGARTVPCTRQTGVCVCLERGIPRRWTGFLAAVSPDRVTKLLAEITAYAASQCPELLDRAVSLRGRQLVLTRLGLHRNSRVRAELSAERVAGPLPRCPDVRQTLYALWGELPGESAGAAPAEK